jgi:hypothetical protein
MMISVDDNPNRIISCFWIAPVAVQKAPFLLKSRSASEPGLVCMCDALKKLDKTEPL